MNRPNHQERPTYELVVFVFFSKSVVAPLQGGVCNACHCTGDGKQPKECGEDVIDVEDDDDANEEISEDCMEDDDPTWGDWVGPPDATAPSCVHHDTQMDMDANPCVHIAMRHRLRHTQHTYG